MSELFQMREHPELEAPVLILATDGWIDAGMAMKLALNKLLTDANDVVVGSFDTDVLLDHRARRPTMHLVDGVNTGLTWPVLDIVAGSDREGSDVLILVGAEPDHNWRAFSDEVVNIAMELGVRLVIGLGAYPAPTPHTRPSNLASTASSGELAEAVGYVNGVIDVPAGVHAAIERRCVEVGLPAVGLWAQVPHYAAGMPYPAGAVSLLEGLRRIGGLNFDPGDLHEDAESTRSHIDELISSNREHQDMVSQLEHEWDSREASREGTGALPSGDELAAELERFLRDQG